MDFFDLDRTFPKLRPHLPVFLASYALFNVIHLFLVPLIGNLLFPAQWNKMNRRARNNWAIHVCSQAHALIIVPLALRRLQLPELDANRAFGWNEQSGTLQAIAVAYFLWDAIDAIYNFESVGFVLHGVACTAIYLCAFKPFLAYYAARCLLWETSTIFLNNHWALDKMNRTGGTMQLLNGVFLISSFFLVRLMYGGYTSYHFFVTLHRYRDQIPLAGAIAIGSGNILLQGLNWFWFTKMISSLRKRFEPEKAANGSANGRSHGATNGFKRD
ncbi:unnamed protein product [Mycena citricolor]|uniref:TLC domain-containing protein n=1 Tax=Mycena citricolor TaxID=2018698 RepID=A0AAD2HM27_9AGAR|nr:unnamed protein product [Mycena citricolor]